jgi:uncharacterized membrane protein YidH (DUF202 family)
MPTWDQIEKTVAASGPDMTSTIALAVLCIAGATVVALGIFKLSTLGDGGRATPGVVLLVVGVALALVGAPRFSNLITPELNGDQRQALAVELAPPLDGQGWTLLPAETITLDKSDQAVRFVALNKAGTANDCTLTWPASVDTAGVPNGAPRLATDPALNCATHTEKG